MWFIPPGKDTVFKGFVSIKGTQGCADGMQTIRRFKFASVSPVSNVTSSEMVNPIKTTGCIELPQFDDTEKEVERTVNVDEKMAIKSACSVKTARANTEKNVAIRVVPGKFADDPAREPKVITIYLREKYLLESRNIIDGAGNLNDNTPVVLTGKIDSCEKDAVNAGKQRKK